MVRTNDDFFFIENVGACVTMDLHIHFNQSSY